MGQGGTREGGAKGKGEREKRKGKEGKGTGKGENTKEPIKTCLEHKFHEVTAYKINI